MSYLHDSPTGGKIDLIIYSISAILMALSQITDMEGTLKIVALILSIVGFLFTAINQIIKFSSTVKNMRKNRKKNKKEEEDYGNYF